MRWQFVLSCGPQRNVIARSKFFRSFIDHNRGIGILHRTRLTVTHGDTSNRAMKSVLKLSLIRAYVEGAAGLFDIFGTRAPEVKLGTLEDDVLSVCLDFHAVEEALSSRLSRTESNDSRK